MKRTKNLGGGNMKGEVISLQFPIKTCEKPEARMEKKELNETPTGQPN